jgi:hypothetical protein
MFNRQVLEKHAHCQIAQIRCGNVVRLNAQFIKHCWAALPSPALKKALKGLSALLTYSQ